MGRLGRSALPDDDSLLLEDWEDVAAEALAGRGETAAPFSRIGDRLPLVVDHALVLGHQRVDSCREVVAASLEPGGKNRGVEIPDRDR